jgi:hypothetical protein
MRIVTEGGFEPIVVRGSRQASKLARYTSSVGHFLRTGERDRLAEFAGEEINGVPLVTNPDTLIELAQAGSLQLEELYVHPGESL